MSIQFPRFKKKTLTLAYLTSQIELADILKKIKNKKLFQCILKDKVDNIIDQKLINVDTSVGRIIKLSKTKILIGCGNYSIKIVDLTSGICINSFSDCILYISCVTKLSKSQIASGCKDYSIKIWELPKFNCLKTLVGHYYVITTIAKLDDNKIVSGSKDLIILWDLDSGNCLNSITTADIPLEIIKLNNDKILIVFENKGTICQIYDLIKCYFVKTVKKYNSSVYSCAKLSKTGIAVGIDEDKSIIILDFVTGEFLNTLNGLRSIAVSLTKIRKKLLVSGTSGGSITIWNLIGGNCLKTFIGHEEDVLCIFKFSKYQIQIDSNFFSY